MKPTTEILARISQNSLANKEEVFTKLYRYLLRPDIYFVAYKNLYANNGAATKGVNEDTADGFSEAKIDSIIKALADETYQPMPVRRTYIQKKNNRKKLRPLGIPTFTDKLVQDRWAWYLLLWPNIWDFLRSSVWIIQRKNWNQPEHVVRIIR